MNNSIEVKTTPCIDGKIIQEVVLHNLDRNTVIMRQVMDTMDHQTREALISLGWTPPNVIYTTPIVV